MGIARWTLVTALALGAAACDGKPADSPPAHGHDASHCADCTKAKADPKGGWCDRCNVGYVAGVETPCKACAQGAVTGTACPTHAKR